MYHLLHLLIYLSGCYNIFLGFLKWFLIIFSLIKGVLLPISKAVMRSSSFLWKKNTRKKVHHIWMGQMIISACPNIISTTKFFTGFNYIVRLSWKFVSNLQFIDLIIFLWNYFSLFFYSELNIIRMLIF